MDTMRLFKRENGIYYIEFKRGRWKSLKTKNKELAQKAFKRLQKQLLLGRVVSIDPEKNISVNDFIKDYLRVTGTGKASPSKRSDRLSLDTFVETLTGRSGARPINTVTRKHLDEMISTLQTRGLKAESINTYIRRIKAAFNKAVEWKYITANPFLKVKQVKVEKKKPRFLYGKEIKKLFAAITDQDFKNMVFFYINTGLRRAELVRLKWGDIIELENSYTIWVRKTKTSTERTVEATPAITALIDRMTRGDNEEYVFPRWRTPDAVTRLFREYADNSEIQHIRLHDLRHTTASHLVMAGVDLKTVGQILGHTRTSTTDIYAHLTKDHVKEAMAKLGNAFNLHTIDSPTLVTTRNKKKK